MLMEIRNARQDDLPLLTRIMIRSFRTAFADFVSPEILEKNTVEENCLCLLESVYQEESTHFLTDGRSGMLVWQDQGDAAEITALHTLPENRDSGLGQALLATALGQLNNRPVFLWAFEKNVRARRFYEKNGFHWDGSQRISAFDGAVEVRYTNTPA